MYFNHQSENLAENLHNQQQNYRNQSQTPRPQNQNQTSHYQEAGMDQVYTENGK